MNENKAKGNLRYLYEDKNQDGESILRYVGEDRQHHYVGTSTSPGGGGDSSDAVTGITINGTTKTPTNGIVNLGDVATPVAVVSVTGATPTKTLSPNTFYKFTTPVTSFSGVTLGSATSGIVNIYAFSFIAGADNVSPLLTGAAWANGFEPELSEGDYCEVTIMDDIATFISHTPAETT